MLIHVKVLAESKKDFVEEITPTSFKVYVKEPAENNRANQRMISLVAQKFGIVTGKVKIMTGHHQPSKILEIKD